MPDHFPIGAKVRWPWGAHAAQGKVVERFERRVQRTLEGTRVVRRTSGNRAYLVWTDDGKTALKRGRELRSA